jgi:hypothetical protein
MKHPYTTILILLVSAAFVIHKCSKTKPTTTVLVEDIVPKPAPEYQVESWLVLNPPAYLVRVVDQRTNLFIGFRDPDTGEVLVQKMYRTTNIDILGISSDPANLWKLNRR